jgi:uncharacterized membrane-anchored protein
MKIKGTVRLGSTTKDLVKSLQAGEIAVIDHKDLDQLAASSLVHSNIKAVLNNSQSISGKYPNLGPEKLVEAEVPIIDFVEDNLFDILKTGEKIEIIDGKIKDEGQILATGQELNSDYIKRKLEIAHQNLADELDKFIDNTLNYAKQEKDLILGLNSPEIDTNLRKKEVLIVVRGKDYRKDLDTVVSYIQQVNPVLIGVDGGADALLEHGFKPDIIIGDMDSVSDYALEQNSEIIVHAYPNGDAPGMKRIEELNLEAKKFPASGMSEDIAMLLAYEKNAELIVAVGTHTNMIDFLEKGRSGMASTFLARLKIGTKLVDAKGVSKLYKHNSVSIKSILQLLGAALFPILAIILISPTMKQLISLLIIKLKVSLGI